MIRNTYPEAFESLWKIFIIAAKKGLIGAGGKSKGYDAFKAKQCTSEDAEYLVKCLINQIGAKVRLKQAGEFVPPFQSPERWIRNERFEDVIEQPELGEVVRPRSDQRKIEAAKRYRDKHMGGSVVEAGMGESSLGGIGQHDIRILENWT
ncbi:MAG: hypothetical protein COA78_25165 [Blastopirellula sp.]|nr:MAG: hypothetical protein COA78_25165 [Blastopirellula sp.]